MDSGAIVAVIGGAVVAFLVRFFNVVLEWLAKVLGVEPPAPIPGAGEDRDTPDVPSPP